MASLRIASAWIGVSGTISVLGDFMGFFRRRVPPDPTGIPVSISVLQQLNRLRGPHFHLNVTLVGVDNFADSDDIKLDYSIFKIRNIYAQVGVGVGRVLHFAIPVAQAHGLDSLTTESQITTLTNTFLVNNNGIDVHVPFQLNVQDISGGSPTPGPCAGDKDDKLANATVISLSGSDETAQTLGHEVGHYLGLSHQDSDPKNLMFDGPSKTNPRASIKLTTAQGNTIKSHCMVQSGALF